MTNDDISCFPDFSVISRKKAAAFGFPTHEPLLQTCAHTPKPPINTSTFASIFYLGTQFSKLHVPKCIYKHKFYQFWCSKPA